MCETILFEKKKEWEKLFDWLLEHIRHWDQVRRLRFVCRNATVEFVILASGRRLWEDSTFSCEEKRKWIEWHVDKHIEIRKIHICNRRVPSENYLETGWTFWVVLWFIRVSRCALSFCLQKVFSETLGSWVSRKPWIFSYRRSKKWVF